MDDDDDFVTPPVRGKGKGKRVVRHSEADLAATERVMVPTPSPEHDILSSGSGFSHKGGKTKAYSMYTRFMAMEDWFAGMDSSVIATKYGIVSSRSLRRWLEEFGRGEYDQCMDWDKKTLMNTLRMKGAGHPLEDKELEKILLNFMNSLKKDYYSS